VSLKDGTAIDRVYNVVIGIVRVIESRIAVVIVSDVMHGDVMHAHVRVELISTNIGDGRTTGVNVIWKGGRHWRGKGENGRSSSIAM